MNDIEMTIRDFSIYTIIGGTILGALFGLIPFVLGRRRNKERLGLYGFIASIVAGALTGVFSIIVAAIFSWVIVRGTSIQNDGADPVTHGTAPEAGSE